MYPSTPVTWIRGTFETNTVSDLGIACNLRRQLSHCAFLHEQWSFGATASITYDGFIR